MLIGMSDFNPDAAAPLAGRGSGVIVTETLFINGNSITKVFSRAIDHPFDC
jgi:hypothetical protein